MWIIELNIASYRYTREMPDLRRPRLISRRLHWPVPRHGHSHAA